MVRIPLSPHDLARVGLAASADPMAELASSVHLLRRRESLAFSWWKRRVRPRLPESAKVLGWLFRPNGTVPEFLLPTAGRVDVEAGLAAVAGTPPRQLVSDLRDHPADGDAPRWARALATGDTSGLTRLAEVLRDYFDVAIKPYWDTVHGQVEADRSMRARILLSEGVDPLLASLAPSVRWAHPVLEAQTTGDLPRLGGIGLVLVPTYFAASPAVLPVPAEQPVRLAYPAVRQAISVLNRRGPNARTPSTKALAALLGPTRAAALVILTAGCSTSELATRLGVSPSAVSKHTTVLRQAGLISTHRDRNTVHHSLTPLGTALLGS